MFDVDSDYVVEHYLKPDKIRVPLVNDESADLLGNFDDSKRKKIIENFGNLDSDENPCTDDNDDDNEENESDGGEGKDDISDGNVDYEDDEQMSDDENNSEPADNRSPETTNTPSTKSKSINKKSKIEQSKLLNKSSTKSESKPAGLTNEQISALMRGASKQNRFVLYVTNLNYESTRERLMEFFGVAGTVKSVRIPKSRRTAFAFVEMADIDGFKNALSLHNKTLENYTIKIQVSEGGKKKSANKKNILKQKNRKLAEMRNETKQFNRSGKGYDRTIKKEIHQRQMQQTRRLAKKQTRKAKA